MTISTDFNNDIKNFLVDSSSILVFIFDNNDKILYSNIEKEQTFTLTSKFSDILALSDQNLPIMDTEGTYGPFRLSLSRKQKTPESYLFTFIKKQKETLAIGEKESEEIQKLKDYLLISQSESQNLNRELQKTNYKLETTVKTLNEFIGMLAHDMKTPLSMINLYTNFLQRELKKLPVEISEEYLNKISHNSRTINQMINEMLEISKLESGIVKLKYHKIKVNEFFFNLTDNHKDLLSTKSIDSILNIKTSDNLEITLDPYKIEQVVNNLVVNALKYSPEQTTISYELSNDNSFFYFSIEDEGPGIDTSEQTNVFKAFYKTKNKVIGEYSSNGLGLAIVKKIIDSHNGKIWIDNSKKTSGCRFVFSIPLIFIGENNEKYS